MKKEFLSLLLSIITICNTFSQWNSQEFKLTGTILESENKDPLEYATITLLSVDDNSVVTGGLSDKNGNYSIAVKKGNYNLLIEYISYKNYLFKDLDISKNIEFKNIELDLDIESLDEVEIIAENTTVDIRLDKKIYTVGRDLTSFFSFKNWGSVYSQTSSCIKFSSSLSSFCSSLKARICNLK